MIRNLKALGLALGALFAFSAAMASTASAVDTLTVGKSPAIVTGEPHHGIDALHQFEITGAKFKIECTHALFAGTTTNGSSKITIFPTYWETTPGDKCKSTIGTALVDMNECTYDLTGNTANEHPKGSGKFDAIIWISCPAGKEIKITGPLACTISIHSQTPTEGGVTYTTETEASGKKDLKIHATVTGITYTATNACTAAGIPTEGNDADYTGTVTAKAYEDKGGTKHPFTEGAQIDLTDSIS